MLCAQTDGVGKLVKSFNVVSWDDACVLNPKLRRWLDELIADPSASAETIAKREGCSTRKINMTISLAFLAPDLVKAAIDGRLPHGMGVARLTDLPAVWSRQYQMLGLPGQ